jgi:hypothetical protein
MDFNGSEPTPLLGIASKSPGYGTFCSAQN